jgi:hypothetical protein
MVPWHANYSSIPEGRALVLIFLISKDYDILLEAAEEVMLNFKDQWVVFAENEEIANHPYLCKGLCMYKFFLIILFL